MKILYIHQYFRTPEEGGSVRSFYLAKKLVSKGFGVEVITTFDEERSRTTDIDGIKVHYLPIAYNNKFSYRKRILSFSRFVILSIIKSNEIKSVDVCYIMTTPLTTGFIGLYNRWIRKIPYIFEVGDLWPEVPIQMGIIKNRWIQWNLYKLEKIFYSQALAIVALSPSIKAYINNIISNKPIEVIPNISDCTFFNSSNATSKIKLKYNIRDEFVISYTGTIGKANQLEYLVMAASTVQNLPIKFLIIGDGAEKSRLKTNIREKGLKNISLYPAMDKTGVRDVLAVTHAAYISFYKIETLYTGSPNKFFDGLAAGKMIISNLGGWTKEVIEDNQVGFYHDPEKPDEFREKIEPFLSKDSKLLEYQSNSKKLAENEFSLQILSERQSHFIQKVTSGS